MDIRHFDVMDATRERKYSLFFILFYRIHWVTGLGDTSTSSLNLPFTSIWQLQIPAQLSVETLLSHPHYIPNPSFLSLRWKPVANPSSEYRNVWMALQILQPCFSTSRGFITWAGLLFKVLTFKFVVDYSHAIPQNHSTVVLTWIDPNVRLDFLI